MFTPQEIEGIKEWSKFIGLVAAVASLVTGAYQLWLGRKQRATELLWKQINTAKELLSDIHTHDLAKGAVHMLDWCHGSGEYEICPGQRVTISYDQVLAALKKSGESSPSKADEYIRDCFDWFFYRVDRIQHYINRELIDFQDVESVFRPYAKLIAHEHDTFYAFLDFHEYSLAKEFLENYKITPDSQVKKPATPATTTAGQAAGA
jgi:hypothetical protein